MLQMRTVCVASFLDELPGYENPAMLSPANIRWRADREVCLSSRWKQL